MNTEFNQDVPRRGLQFGIRTLLSIVTATAVIVWGWPHRIGDELHLHVSLGLLWASLITTLACAPSAWANYRARFPRDLEISALRSGEKFAFVCGLLSIVPYGAFGLMIYLDPLVSRFHGVHQAMAASAYLGVVACLPIVLALLFSFALFFRWCENFPLFVMRIAGLTANGLWLPYLLLGIAGNA